MNVVATRKRMTVDEFLQLPETEEKRELVDGEITPMTPATILHARTAQNIFVELRTAIREAKLPCEAFINEPGVVTGSSDLFIPDVVVQCGSRAEDDSRTLDAPVIIVEVLSPSSRGVDTGKKFLGYARLRTLRHFVIVDAINKEVCHQRLDENGQASGIRLGPGDPLSLDPPGLKLAVAEFFDQS